MKALVVDCSRAMRLILGRTLEPLGMSAREVADGAEAPRHTRRCIDGLTGLPNRRGLDQALEANDAAVALLVIDLDHFKQVNDREGRLVGDVVLRIVAERLKLAVPAGGCLGRWVDEEFLCVLPGLDLGAAVLAGESLRRSVGVGPIILDGSRELRLTVSIGVSAGAGRDSRGVLREAKSAVSEAKRAGRNRVVPATGVGS